MIMRLRFVYRTLKPPGPLTGKLFIINLGPASRYGSTSLLASPIPAPRRLGAVPDTAQITGRKPCGYASGSRLAAWDQAGLERAELF